MANQSQYEKMAARQLHEGETTNAEFVQAAALLYIGEQLERIAQGVPVESVKVDGSRGGPSRCSMYAAEFNDHENSLPAAQTRLLLATLLREEADEALEALTIANAPLADGSERIAFQHLARELADVVYVCFTGAWAFGIDLDAALAEIHRAAMDKVLANVRREDGKIIKPPGFVPPSMEGVVT